MKSQHSQADNPYYGKVFGFSLDEVIFKTVKDGGVWEPHFEPYFRDAIKPRSTAIDAGANIGLHSIMMSRLCPEATIYAFEANPYIYELLIKNTRPYRNIKAYNIALSESNKSLYIKDPSDSCNPGGARVFEEPGSGIGVAAKPLDSLNLDDVSAIKIDVEGHESALLLGAILTIKRCSPVIFCECYETLSAVTAILEPLGYSHKPIDAHNYLFTQS